MPLHGYDRRSNATLISVPFGANETANLSAPQPGDGNTPAEATAGTSAILNGDCSETQSNTGNEFAQRDATFLSDIPASDVSTEYLRNLLVHDPVLSTSTDTSTSQTQRQWPARARVNNYAMGAARDLARSAPIETSSSGDQVQSPAEVSINSYEFGAVGTPDPDAQHKFNELLARLQDAGASLAADASNAVMSEQVRSTISIQGRERSPGPPLGAQDAAAAASLLPLSANELSNGEVYIPGHQRSCEEGEEYLREHLEDSTKYCQVANEHSGNSHGYVTYMDQIPVDEDLTKRFREFFQYAQATSAQLPPY